MTSIKRKISMVSLEDKKKGDAEYWASLSPGERLEIAYELNVAAFALAGIDYENTPVSRTIRYVEDDYLK